MSDYDWGLAAYRPLPDDPRPNPPTPTPPPVPAPGAHMPGEARNAAEGSVALASPSSRLANERLRGAW